MAILSVMGCIAVATVVVLLSLRSLIFSKLVDPGFLLSLANRNAVFQRR